MTLLTYDLHSRLRQVDVKAEHFERQVQRLEQERDQWEKKYEVCGLYNHLHFVASNHSTYTDLCRFVS